MRNLLQKLVEVYLFSDILLQVIFNEIDALCKLDLRNLSEVYVYEQRRMRNLLKIVESFLVFF